MKFKIPQHLMSPTANALFGTWCLIIFDLFVKGLTPWNIFPDVKSIPNPSYDSSLGEIWIEACGPSAVPHEIECDYYDANSQFINDPASQSKIVYVLIGVAIVIFIVSKICIKIQNKSNLLLKE